MQSPEPVIVQSADLSQFRINMPTANISEQNLYTVGGSCIIYMYEYQTYNWGTVESIEVEEKSYGGPRLVITAKFTGGEFKLDEKGNPVYTSEKKGDTPFYSYSVYPDTPSLRTVLSDMLKRNSNLNNKLRTERVKNTALLEAFIAIGGKK